MIYPLTVAAGVEDLIFRELLCDAPFHQNADALALQPAEARLKTITTSLCNTSQSKGGDLIWLLEEFS